MGSCLRDTTSPVKLLALDTATSLCGVAVADTNNNRSASRLQTVSTHSDMLLTLISDCLDELALKPTDLDGIICGAGPGSFTGLRIGLATAKGLCFATDRPLVMVSSLAALAGRSTGWATARPVLAVLDAFRAQVYARLLLPEDGQRQLSPQLQGLLVAQPQLLEDAVWDPAALAALLQPVAAQLSLCGAALAKYPVLRLPSAQVLHESESPDPRELLQLGLMRLQAGYADSLMAAVPNYVCASAAEVNSAAASAAVVP